ncbi:hypothetical protein P7K49_005347 [Saguinus oedipus]|uniref:Uncharacterized protein n=1 Tax=Saguinus oedipus TaxID=9490 RepID=A0ABQ9W9Z1_SAGOE|nr:hypothetical protein P7K49_005347 [Saguinus oedipus]
MPPGHHDQSKTKVLHKSPNPASAARQGPRKDHNQLQAECKRQRGRRHGVCRHLSLTAELRKQAESGEPKNQRPKEALQTKIQESHKSHRSLSGHQIDTTTENQHLTAQSQRPPAPRAPR